jgi:hypothetical protein
MINRRSIIPILLLLLLLLLLSIYAFLFPEYCRIENYVHMVRSTTYVKSYFRFYIGKSRFIKFFKDLDNIRYLQPSTRVLAYQYSFFPSIIRLWTNLPQTLVSSGSTNIFRHSLTNTSLP